MSKPRRSGKRRSPSTQHARNNAAFQRKIAAKQRLAKALRKKAAVVRAIRARDEQRIENYRKNAGGGYVAASAATTAARSARGSPPLPKHTPKPAKVGEKRLGRGTEHRSVSSPTGIKDKSGNPMSYKQIRELNKRRAVTRNKWKNDPCVERPDHRKANKMRQDPKHKGAGVSAMRRWC